MGWEIAIIGSVVLVVLGLFHIVGVFDKKEHAMLKIFLFFIGLFLIVINFNIGSHIIEANNATINNSAIQLDLAKNMDTAYWVGVMAIIVSFMYWFIYFIRKGLETLKIKRSEDIGETDINL